MGIAATHSAQSEMCAARLIVAYEPSTETECMSRVCTGTLWEFVRMTAWRGNARRKISNICFLSCEISVNSVIVD